MSDFDEFYRRIAMTMEKAREILGVPPSASAAEIDKAYKNLLVKNHPDKGGTDEQAQELSLAHGILKGKGRPTYDRRPDEDGPTPSRGPAYQYTPPESRTVTFDEAASKSGVPSNVEWMFVTPNQRDKHGWMGDSSSKRTFAFVAYGRTDSQHVFFAALNHMESSSFALGGYTNDIWTAKSYEYPIRENEGQNPAWLYGKVVQALKSIGFNGKFNSKAIDAKGWKVEERRPQGAEVSIKHWLVNSGHVSGDAPSVAGRKQVVELTVNESIIGDPKPGYYPEPHKPSNFWKGEYHGRYYKITLNINGRPYVLNEADTTKFLGLNRPLDAIFGTYYYDGSKKVLTRMPKGKKILAWMGESFTGLPPEAMQALQAAAAQMKG